MVANLFRQIYPFTTENLAGYFPYLDLKNKSVLTVGSSLDQAFNALVYGAKDICVYDINKYVEDFYDFKKKLVLNKNRNEFCEAVFECDMPIIKWHPSFDEYVLRNTYLQSDYNYNLLRYRLEEDNISFINGDIFELDKYLGENSYDRILFSNIFAYIDFFASERNIDDELSLLKDNFDSFIGHLNNDGFLQLMYYYDYNPFMAEENSIYDVIGLKELLNCDFDMRFIPAVYGSYPKEDGVLIYKKRM